MQYYFYILYSERFDRYYIGSSGNPHRRLLYHNTIEKGFTARFRPWQLVFTLKFATKKLAQEAERKVKSWKSKRMVQKLIPCEIQL